jgi:hypothetical protein
MSERSSECYAASSAAHPEEDLELLALWYQGDEACAFALPRHIAAEVGTPIGSELSESSMKACIRHTQPDDRTTSRSAVQLEVTLV